MSQQIGNATLHLGDCLDVLRTLPDNSVDSIVTDPMYGLGKEPDALAMLRDWMTTGHHDHKNKSGFMGKEWDAFVPQPTVWAECLRVLKPGGHLLAFAGTRTQHLMALGLQIAGFEIRDMLAWLYGSGFPKSLDVSKAIDKAAGAEREIVGTRTKAGIGGSQTFAQDAWAQANRGEIELDITTPATEAAKQWQGWGTALKPSLEPITMARKPFACTVAANVLQHGTGALNIDASRVEHGDVLSIGSGGIPARHDEQVPRGRRGQESATARYSENGSTNFSATPGPRGGDPAGRWPANLIHDGSAEVLAAFPQTSSGMMAAGTVREAQDEPGSVCYGTYGGNATSVNTPGDAGSAARFFYCAKASAEDRNEGCAGLPEKAGGMVSNTSGQHISRRDGGAPGPRANHHPTVKPTDLMRYLLRLVTPPHGVALDPFLGSGSTGKAAMLEDLRFIGIERDPAYFAIACARLEHSIAQGSLFAPSPGAAQPTEAVA